MIFVIGPDQHVYIEAQSTSGAALDRAVRKFNPGINNMKTGTPRFRRESTYTWTHMKQLGYTLLDKPSTTGEKS